MAMDHQRPSDVSDTYTIGDIRDSRGIAIGSNNAIYNYFLDGRYRPLAEHIISFDWLIDQAREFVGRAFLLDQLDAFLAQYAQGYIVLTGEPGIGKTAFLAWLVHERHYPHHFNIALQGIRSPEQFLENICAQLIMRYKLDLAFLPLTVGRDGSFLNSLLYRISEKLRGTEEAIVLVVDAIDEVTVVEGANILYLPPTLPGRVYFVLSARVFPRQLSIATDYRAVVIDAAAPEHIHDLRIYLHRAATDPRLAAILTDSAITVEQFVALLQQKSAGNFVYLHYVLSGLVRGELSLANFDQLPDGLRSYYDVFWQSLRQDRLVRQIFSLLSIVREPVPVSLVAAFLQHVDQEDITWSFDRHREYIVTEHQNGVLHYRLYHASFQEYLHQQIDTQSCHRRVTQYYAAQCQGSWDQLDDAFAARHLAYHVYAAREWQTLNNILISGFAHRKARQSFLALAPDLEYGIGAARQVGPQSLPDLLRHELVLAGMRTQADSLPSTFFEVLARLGQHERANGLASMIPDPLKRTQALRLISSAIAATQPQVAIKTILAALDELPVSTRAAGRRNIDTNTARASLLIQLAPLDIDATLAHVETIDEPYFRCKIYIAAAQAQAQKNTQTTLATLRLAYDQAWQDVSYFVTLGLLRQIANSALEVDTTFAREVLLRAWSFARSRTAITCPTIAEFIGLIQLMWRLDLPAAQEWLDLIWRQAQRYRDDALLEAELYRFLATELKDIRPDLSSAAARHLQTIERRLQRRLARLPAAGSDKVSDYARDRLESYLAEVRADRCSILAQTDLKQAIKLAEQLYGFPRVRAFEIIAHALAVDSVRDALEIWTRETSFQPSKAAELITYAVQQKPPELARSTILQALAFIDATFKESQREELLMNVVATISTVDQHAARDIASTILLHLPWHRFQEEVFADDQDTVVLSLRAGMLEAFQQDSLDTWVKDYSGLLLVENDTRSLLQSLFRLQTEDDHGRQEVGQRLKIQTDDSLSDLLHGLTLLPVAYAGDQASVKELLEAILSRNDESSDGARERIMPTIAETAVLIVRDEDWLQVFLSRILQLLHSPGRQSAYHRRAEIAVIQLASCLMISRESWWEFVCDLMHEQAKHGSDHLLAAIKAQHPLYTQRYTENDLSRIKQVLAEVQRFFDSVAQADRSHSVQSV